jgi:hypothetical protein
MYNLHMEPINNSAHNLQNARDIQRVTQERSLWAEQRNSAIADEFIRLEVQIATIIFAFASLFVVNFSGSGVESISDSALLLMKLSFVFSMFCLLLSLAFGLLHLKAHEGFWDTMLKQRLLRHKKWCEVTEKDVSFEVARAYHDGTALGDNVVVSAPEWTWILQTVFLALGVTTLFILSVIFLFS